MRRILVIGSLNMDSVIEMTHMPRAGETISGKNVLRIPGGKGANQAYAAGKLGGLVGIIGAVGDDPYGEILKNNLEQAGVDTSGLSVIKGGTTGQAFITVDERGENSIIIIAGTNADVTKEMIKRHLKKIEECDIVIMQMEIPIETVIYVKELAVSLGKTVIIDPAPAQADLPDHFWKDIDFIKPNETELEIITGKKMNTMEDLVCGARDMCERGVKGVIVTLGKKGCLFVTEKEEKVYMPYEVKAVDTTAAGDCFTAAFALALSEGKSCEEAILFGQKVSAIAVTRRGAQMSVPDRAEVEKFESNMKREKGEKRCRI